MTSAKCIYDKRSNQYHKSQIILFFYMKAIFPLVFSTLNVIWRIHNDTR